MPAFTDLAGIPMTAHAAMLRGRLRRELGFDGVLVSDYNAIAELIQHGVAADLVEAATLALKAGVDIDMVSGAYLQGLPLALERGLVSQAEIDESVRRVLTLKEPPRPLRGSLSARRHCRERHGAHRAAPARPGDRQPAPWCC